MDTEFDIRLGTKSTSEVKEGSNLYYTNARMDTEFDIRLGTKSTSEVKEGSNLYYTNQRFINDYNDNFIASSNSIRTSIGWNGTINSGFKTITPFYVALYLNNNYSTTSAGITQHIPFIIDSTLVSSERPSSTNASSYWNVNYFTPPVNGIYVMNYSFISSDNGTIYFTKNSSTTNSYADIFGTSFYSPNSAITTSHSSWTTTNTHWYFSYIMKTTNQTIYNDYTSTSYMRGVTKGSILLIQETA